MSTEIQKQEVKQVPISPIDRFRSKVVSLFEANNGGLELTKFQNKLIQAYFIKLDSILKAEEIKRMAKSEQFRSEIPCVWASVNMDKLSQEVIAFAGVGLDPLQKNHINLILYPMRATGLIDVGFIIGYRGKELVAKKYGYKIAENFVIEVVFENDVFEPIKKDQDNPFSTYKFKMPKPFNRGAIVGGFYFHEYKKEPEKNILEVFDLKAIEKRKPKSASAEFWGGSKKVKEWFVGDDGKKKQVEVEKEMDGWFEEMVYKTLHLACFGDVVIDSEKIDDHLQNIMAMESEPAPVQETAAEAISNTVNQNANKKVFNFDEAEEIKDQHEEDEIKKEKEPEQPAAQLQEPEKVDILSKVGRENEAEPVPVAAAPKSGRQPSFFPQ